MLTFEFTGVEGRMTESEVLTSGMVGKTVRLSFDSSWSGLTKTVVFRSGEVCKTADGSASTVTVPREVLARPFLRLYVGVYGTDASGTLVIPTVMAEGPMIRYGADPMEDSTAENLPVWFGLQEQIGDLKKLNTDSCENLVAAINELHSRQAHIGNLDDLETNTAMSLVAAINELHSLLQQIPSGGTGLSETAAALLIEILRHAVYTSDQSGNIDALESELSPADSGETPDNPDTLQLTGLSAFYSGGDVPVGTDLADLSGITVTAHYSDGSTQAVTDYTISGTIAAGTNMITVSYMALSASFTVTGIALLTSLIAVYSGGDVPVGTPLNQLTGIQVTAVYSDGSRQEVSSYSLSGTISEGRNTITVRYQNKSAFFSVQGIPEEGDAAITHISATYLGGDVPAGTDLADLTGITVTAHYSDGVNMMIEDYTLSGQIGVGPNTVTVSYRGFTATVSVTGTEVSVQSETLEIVYASSYPNVTTFAYTEQTNPSTYAVAKRGNLKGGLLSVDFDASYAVNWNLNLYVFDADGNPYLQTDKSTVTNGSDLNWGIEEPKWEAVGAGTGFGTVSAPFQVQLPEGCTCIACFRAGQSGISDFSTWAKNGGVTFTVTATM